MTSPKIPESLRRIVLASNNAGKLREFSALFAPLGVELVPQGELGVPEAEEPHVTFVENACVHGIESKAAPGWIFVRIFKKAGFMHIEVEDTGSGIDPDALEKMKSNMKNADIDMLKTGGRVGVINACLRIKMVTESKAVFDVDSEEGCGTTVMIKIPETYL